LDGKEYDVKLPVSYLELERLLNHYSFAFESIKEPRLVHWDLHDGNVIVTQDGTINGIIDCDRAIWGDPLIEYYLKDYDKQTNFMDEYGELIYKDEHAAVRRHFYNIYLYLIITIESYYRNYDDSHKKWTYDLLDKEILTLAKKGN
jgi:fructosamine-3-kinase